MNMPKWLRKLVVIFSFLIFANSTNAAEISIVPDYMLGDPAIEISGEIVRGDYEKIKDTIKVLISKEDYKILNIYLNSPGGDAQEAMRIGHLLRKLLANTWVIGFDYFDPESSHGIELAEVFREHPSSQVSQRNRVFVPRGQSIPKDQIVRCYSACVLIFYSGANRNMSDNTYFADSSRVIPAIGLHRPYYSDEYYSKLTAFDAQLEYKNLEKEISAYLLSMGAPQRLVERMLNTPSNNIDLVNHEEFKYLYRTIEPFYEEWLIAKCGATSDGNTILNEEDYTYYKKIREEKRAEARKSDSYYRTFTSYFPRGANIERYNAASSKVTRHNDRVNQCGSVAVREHQVNWANSN